MIVASDCEEQIFLRGDSCQPCRPKDRSHLSRKVPSKIFDFTYAPIHPSQSLSNMKIYELD